MRAVASTINFTPHVMAKPIIKEQNGDFTSNLLEITSMHAATAFLGRETTQHNTSHSMRVPADLNSTNH